MQSAADAAGLKEARELIAKQERELSDLREALEEAKEQVRTLLPENHFMFQIICNEHSYYLHVAFSLMNPRRRRWLGNSKRKAVSMHPHTAATRAI